MLKTESGPASVREGSAGASTLPCYILIDLKQRAFDARSVNLMCDSRHFLIPLLDVSCLQVEPYLAYGLLFLNLAVYGAGIALALTAGNDFSNEWFFSLAKINDKVANGELYRWPLLPSAPCSRM